MHPDPATSSAAAGQVALRYVGSNPNGSVADVAGVCDPTGLVLGPHAAPGEPRDRPPAPGIRPSGTRGDASGLPLFEQGVRHAKERARCSAVDLLPEPFMDVDLGLADRRDGKVRVSYAWGTDRLFVTTDRLSALDRVIAGVPYKGQVLNQLAAWWFARTADIVDNHVVDLPDPNVPVARSATPLPVEVVVRGVITGVTSTSIWQMYAAGQRTVYGHRLPDGLAKNTRLPEAIVTPTTKAEHGGHDEPLTCADVVARGLVEPALWGEVQRVALALFARGQAVAAAAGLILADTKYELGLADDGTLLLIDEVHTPDSVALLDRAHLR